MSRMERQIQLNNLESVIEKKKREIQAKLEAEKKKETEEALIKIQKNSETPPRRPFWKGNNKAGSSKTAKVEEAPVKFTNVFSNDGSFLDQFRKLSKSGLKPDKVDVETLAIARKAEEKEKERRKIVEEEKNQRQIERNIRERERELRKIDRVRDRRRSEFNQRECSPKRVPLDANIKIELPPPGVVQFVPQVQLIAPVVLTPMPQIVLNPAPPFTTNEIQLQAAGITPSSASCTPSLPILPPPIRNMLPVMTTPSLPSISLPISVAPIATIPPPLPIAPHSIPPPSPIQVDSIPPPPSPPNDLFNLPNKKRKKREIAISSCALPPPGYCDEIPLPPPPEKVPAALGRDHSPSFGLLGSGTRHLAKMIATSGDEAEEFLRVAHKDDPALRFLFDQNCAKYKLFRNYIEAYRSGYVEESDDDLKPISDGDSVDDKNKYDPANADDSDSSLFDRYESKYDPTTAHDSDSDSTKNETSYDGSNSNSRFKMESNILYKGSPVESIKIENTNFDFEECGRPSFSGAKTEDNKCNIPFITDEPKQEVKRQRRSRWGDLAIDTPPAVSLADSIPLPTHQPLIYPSTSVPPPAPIGANQVMLHQITRKDPGLLAYARQTFGSINLSEEDWKRAEDHYKINLLYQNMMKKREELDKLARQGKFKYEYDSDEDTEGGTWEHKLRTQEMTASQMWADELTRQAEGKHHIGDFLPPEELDRFLEKYNAVKSGREPDLSDYKEFKLKEDNVGYKLLQKMGWNEGQGLGQEGQGMVNPVNKANNRAENQGLGLERPDGVDEDDDEYSAYRKRMMLAYRFRPNPLNNPRRPYY